MLKKCKQTNSIELGGSKKIGIKYSDRLLSNLESGKTCNFYNDEKSKGTNLVMMGSGKDIEMKNNERIATSGLRGCTAVGFVMEKDGMYMGYIQHYPPIQKSESIRKLSSQIKKLENLGYKMKKSVIMSPGERQKDADGKWKMAFKDHSLVVDLSQSLGVSGDYIISAPYSEVRGVVERYGQGTMAIGVNDGEPYIEVESMKKRAGNGDK